MTIRRWWRAVTSQSVVGGVMIVFTLVSVFQVFRISNIAECTSAYQAGFSAALTVRGTSQERFNNALVDMVATVTTSTNGPQVSKALHEFLTAAAEREKAIHDNPYPAPTVCNA